MQTDVQTNSTDDKTLPPEIDDIIAIAQKIRAENVDNFSVIFQAAVIAYYRSRFSDPFPLVRWQV